uniref:Uncharacterized protein n=1 Tax=Amphilophus citrinellus TaxID=61819 RepID=A0A3Q0TBU7_AMPCI
NKKALTCTKMVLYLRDFLFLLFQLSGVALITIGVLQYSTYSEIGSFTGSSLSQIAIVLIAVGVTIAFVSLLGHIGAFFNNSSMVACVSTVINFLIILLEVLTGAAFYIFRSRVRHLPILPKGNYLSSRSNFTISNGSQEIIEFKCCGADSYADWSQSVGWENHNAVPDSCCVEKSEGCGQDKEKAHKKGCLWAIKFFLMKNLVWVGAVCIVFGVLIGVCLCLDIKKNYETIR